jgi:hypothetical protein
MLPKLIVYFLYVIRRNMTTPVPLSFEMSSTVDFEAMCAANAARCAADRQVKVDIEKKLTASLPTIEATVVEIPIDGKYYVYDTGYVSRIADRISSKLVIYDPESKRFVPRVVTEPMRRVFEEDPQKELECCDMAGDECILFFSDTLWGYGFYATKTYFSMSVDDQIAVSMDIVIIHNRMKDLSSGYVIFENGRRVEADTDTEANVVSASLPLTIDTQSVTVSPTEGTVVSKEVAVLTPSPVVGSKIPNSQFTVFEGFGILKYLEYCAMFDITTTKLLTVTTPSEYSFNFVVVDVDSESG